ncbi:MAG TPA: response regulator [Anaerolineaceae bacterium]|nr:response regulator [Anaerolineaceae bacterium]
MARILFIDDDLITLEILGKAAEILGHQPILMATARPAIAMAAEQKPDLIVMDMMMPDLDGLEALSILRSSPETAETPVVILSAGAALDDEEKVLAAGGQDYLNKPVSLNKLLETIKKYTPA